MLHRLAQRQRDLDQSLQQKRSLREQQADPHESVPRFLAAFDAQVHKAKSAEDCNEARELASVASQMLSKANFFLPPYDQRKCLQILTDLNSSISASHLSTSTPQKFSFSSRLKDSKSATAHKPGAAELSSAAEEILQRIHMNEIRIENVKCGTIHEEPGSINGFDVFISHIQNATIHICDHIGAIRMNHIKNCVILCGPVSGSVHIENCETSTFALAARQIRIHEAVGCDFYVFAASGPIIEDCSKVRFAPYNLEYDLLSDHFTAAGLDSVDPALQFWKDVKDFKWLRQDHSPNWSVIPVDARRAPAQISSSGTLDDEDDI